MIIGKGGKGKFFTSEELAELCVGGLKAGDFQNRKVLVIIPDATRSGPTGLFFKTIYKTLNPCVKKVDFLVASGTHPAMSEEKVNQHLDITSAERKTLYRNTEIFQHCWDNPDQLQYIGTISAAEIAEISGGLLSEDIPVTINKKIFSYERLILVGPVFPHEVVGFSGGYKYLFPGISGPQFLHKFHWLGALITNPKINGTKNTPVRAAINKAVSFLKMPINLFCYVVTEKKVSGFFAGDEQAWSKAADLSSLVNIHYTSRSFHTVLSCAPLMYEELWTAGKCMYKLEPVVADGGTLIIYAPHIREISHTHGENIKKIGYHNREYFLKQWDKFKSVPGGILAHSTHVKGIGTYKDGKEKPRINVILATGIPEEECRKINLGYMNPADIKIKNYAGKENEGVLLVENAGEVLFRLESGEVPDIDKIN